MLKIQWECTKGIIAYIEGIKATIWTVVGMISLKVKVVYLQMICWQSWYVASFVNRGTPIINSGRGGSGNYGANITSITNIIMITISYH